MAKFLVFWRRNMLAPWPADRREIAENTEAMFEAIERYMDAEMITENGFFVDGDSGCFIFEGASEDVFKMTSMFGSFIHYDVKEMIPYEMGKNTIMESVRANALAR
jgi:hypothetical protein